MNRRRAAKAVLLVVFCIGAAAGNAIAFLSRGPLEPGLDDSVDLFTSGMAGYPIFRIPALASLPDGGLVAFCEGRSSLSDAGDIDIVARRFLPGHGWGPLHVLVDAGTDTAGNPCPIYDAVTKALFLFYCVNNDLVYIMNSTDHGASWASPVDITTSVKRAEWAWYATGPGHGIQLSSGRLLAPCDHGFPKTGRTARGSTSPNSLVPYNLSSHVVYSDDHGASWTIGHVFDNGNECMAVEAVNHSIYLTMRVMANRGFPDHRRLAAWSADGGDSFGPIRSVPVLVEPRCQASICRYSTDAVEGTNRVLFLNPASTARDHMTLRVSYDECITWSAGKVVYRGDSAYSDMQVSPGKDILLLFERGIGTPYEKLTLVNTTITWLESGV
ncbi:MAG: exo-alpha-sialidase [Candidatus Lokiarchaeota archaeon]|nr:exo-alpha-sialidase [Candidatus Lokiarchaeota archaeon]